MTSPPSSSPEESRLVTIQRVLAYGPLVVTAVVLVVQTFAPSGLQVLPLPAIMAILTASVVFLVSHNEASLLGSKRVIGELQGQIKDLEATQSAFLKSTTSLHQTSLGAAFATVSNTTPRVGHLRIYAISSQQILSFFQHNNMHVDKCHILLRGFEHEDVGHQGFLNQIRLVVADWRLLQKSGRIGELQIRHYDFFPTEYECIFDADHLILGLYDSNPEDYSEVRVRDPLLVRATSDASRSMILEFSARFDNLFKTCETYHGPNTIDPPAPRPGPGTVVPSGSPDRSEGGHEKHEARGSRSPRTRGEGGK